MIFICVGSREYQFDRLLIEIDNLLDKNLIEEEVFAQIGQSTYIPRNYQFTRFMSSDDFRRKQLEADIIISHGGTGALVGALKLGKQVIAVPRLSKFNEHIDDHQLQVSSELEKQGFLICVIDIADLTKAINKLKTTPILKTFKTESNIVGIIEDYLEGVFNE